MAESYRIERQTGEEAWEDTEEVFEALPAPTTTLGGHLLALQNETGDAHRAVLLED